MPVFVNIPTALLLIRDYRNTLSSFIHELAFNLAQGSTRLTRQYSYPTLPDPGSKKPIYTPTDPWGQPISVAAADSTLDLGTDTSIGVNPDDDLLGTQKLEPESQTIQGFSIPGCPDNYPNAAQASVAASPSITSAAAVLTLYCTDPSFEDGDGICTCTQGSVTTTITPAGGPGNACPTAI